MSIELSKVNQVPMKLEKVSLKSAKDLQLDLKALEKQNLSRIIDNCYEKPRNLINAAYKFESTGKHRVIDSDFINDENSELVIKVIFEKYPNIEHLDFTADEMMSKNILTKLPSNLGILKNLKSINITNHEIKEIPKRFKKIVIDRTKDSSFDEFIDKKKSEIN